MHNKAFWRALHSLAHPVTVGAVTALLLNDHLIRHRWPSWWTGKLGDFAWLMFAPLVCALVVSWVLPHPHPPTPQRTRHALSLQRKEVERTRLDAQEWQVGIMSFAFIGVWFALAKTVPIVHALTTGALEAITGWQGTLRLDATDLLTLPALLIGWHIWRRAGNTPPTLSPRVWSVLALGVMATLASTDPSYSDSGITTICEYGGKFLVTQYYGEFRGPTPDSTFSVTNVFTSDDGGAIWNIETSVKEFDYPDCSRLSSDEVIDPNNSQIQYRFRKAEAIEKSTDGGCTWTLAYDLVELRQDVRVYYHLRKGGWSPIVIYYPGPMSGLIDSKTGNVVFAMGWDGLLLGTPDGEWRWIRLPDYYLEDLNRFDKVDDILFFEFWLAGALGFLVLTTSAAYIRVVGRLIAIWLAAGWIGWVILTIVFLTPYHMREEMTIGVIAVPMLIFIAFPLSIDAILDLIFNFRNFLWRIALIGLGNALLFLLPFVLWTQGTIPPYRTALTFSLLLTAGSLAASYVYLKRILPRVPRPKKPKPTTNDQPPTTSEG